MSKEFIEAEMALFAKQAKEVDEKRSKLTAEKKGDPWPKALCAVSSRFCLLK